MPGRTGTTGVAISCAGFEPVQDLRAQMDLHGNPLKVTFQAVADSISTIANHKMGEGSDSKPFAIVRNSGVEFTDRIINPLEMAISSDQCVYVRGLGKA
jgi:coenzyme F420-0:L-glutamate ligase/coenzyme F420-1:gamma-L-glutamate ligase